MKRNNNINKTRERERERQQGFVFIFFIFLWTKSDERIGAAIMEAAWHAAPQVSVFVLLY